MNIATMNLVVEALNLNADSQAFLNYVNTQNAITQLSPVAIMLSMNDGFGLRKNKEKNHLETDAGSDYIDSLNFYNTAVTKSGNDLIEYCQYYNSTPELVLDVKSKTEKLMLFYRATDCLETAEDSKIGDILVQAIAYIQMETAEKVDGHFIFTNCCDNSKMITTATEAHFLAIAYDHPLINVIPNKNSFDMENARIITKNQLLLNDKCLYTEQPSYNYDLPESKANILKAYEHHKSQLEAMVNKLKQYKLSYKLMANDIEQYASDFAYEKSNPETTFIKISDKSFGYEVSSALTLVEINNAISEYKDKKELALETIAIELALLAIEVNKAGTGRIKVYCKDLSYIARNAQKLGFLQGVCDLNQKEYDNDRIMIYIDAYPYSLDMQNAELTFDVRQELEKDLLLAQNWKKLITHNHIRKANGLQEVIMPENSEDCFEETFRHPYENLKFTFDNTPQVDRIITEGVILIEKNKSYATKVAN